MSTPIFVRLASGDVRAVQGGGNRASFSAVVEPLSLASDRKWELGVTNINLPMPGSYKSVYVTSSLVKTSRVGSFLVPLMCAISPTATPSFIQYAPQIMSWFPLATTEVNVVEVRLTYDDGLPIPPGLTPDQDHTEIDFLIREVPQ